MSRIEASASPAQSPPTTALPGSRAQLLYADAVDGRSQVLERNFEDEERGERTGEKQMKK